MRILVYHQQTIQEIPLTELPKQLADKAGVVWVDLDLHEEADIKVLHEQFTFHHLALEDVHHRNQRPKAEEFDDHLFIILNPIQSLKSLELFHECDVFVGKNYLVTVHQGREPMIEEAQKRLERHRPLASQASYLLYILMDTIVDAYIPVIEQLEEELDVLSEETLHKPNREILGKIHQIKRRVNEIWWVVFPQQDVIHVITHHDTFFDERLEYYLRDVSDHLTRIMTTLQSQRDTVSGLINLYMSSVSNQLNYAVGRLTLFTIGIGIFAVYSGFYGMNFTTTFPPFEADWGVPFVLLLMVLSTVLAFMIMRWRDWL